MRWYRLDKIVIDCQKLGNILTGDGAAASRYIEARSKFALEVIYSPKITDWGMSMMEEELNLTIFPLSFHCFFSTRC
jgi:topoisomerase-4 subunit A